MSNIIKNHEWAYIYALLEPDNVTIRYIGWAIDADKRYKRHFHNSELSKVNHRTNWIKSLLENGLLPILKIIEKIPFSEWKQRERYWVKYYRDLGYDLVNSTPGGDGGGHPVSQENREKLRVFHTGMVFSPETIQKLSNSHKGHKHTKETRQKMSIARKGKPSPLKGIKVSDNIKKKESESHRGKSSKIREIKYVGVYTSGKKYRASLGNNHLGTFITQEEAALAYDNAFKKYYDVDVGPNFR